MEIKAMYDITGEHCCAIGDNVLSTLDLHPAVKVRIDIEETGVKLFIGPWDMNGHEAVSMFAR
jgi:hypothetical protein